MALLLIGEGERLHLQGFYDAAELLQLSFRGVTLARQHARNTGLTKPNFSTGIHETVTAAGYEHLGTLPEDILLGVKDVVASILNPPEPATELA
jgi:hypothetical protein